MPFGQIAMTSHYFSGVEIFNGWTGNSAILEPIGWGTDLSPFTGRATRSTIWLFSTRTGTISVLINVTK
jgi:hypothetical protein